MDFRSVQYPSVHAEEAQCREAQCREAQCREAQCREAQCREAQCREAQCREAQCREAQCREAQCREAQCREAQCQEAVPCTHGAGKQSHARHASWTSEMYPTICSINCLLQWMWLSRELSDLTPGTHACNAISYLWTSLYTASMKSSGRSSQCASQIAAYRLGKVSETASRIICKALMLLLCSFFAAALPQVQLTSR